MRVVSINRHSFVADGLSAESVVFDLGMHRGVFATAMIQAYHCRVIGLEPVPELFAALPSLPGVVAEQKALTGNGEPAILYLNRGACATMLPDLAEDDAETVTISATTLSDLLQRHSVDRVALVKLDIEGAELDVLCTTDPSVLRRVDQFTVEFHDHADPGQEPAIREVSKHLIDQGFDRFKFSRRDHTDVLFWNRSQGPLTFPRRLWLTGRYKYPTVIRRGVRRVFRLPPTP